MEFLPNASFFTRKVTRKEFLFMVGLLILTMTGITSMRERVSKIVNPQKSTHHGFGNGPYGGVKKE